MLNLSSTSTALAYSLAGRVTALGRLPAFSLTPAHSGSRLTDCHSAAETPPPWVFQGTRRVVVDNTPRKIALFDPPLQARAPEGASTRVVCLPAVRPTIVHHH